MEIRVVFPMSLLLWICGTVEQWNPGLSLMVHMVHDLVNDHESCLLNASVDLWNSGNRGLKSDGSVWICGTVELWSPGIGFRVIYDT